MKLILSLILLALCLEFFSVSSFPVVGNELHAVSVALVKLEHWS